MARAYRHDVSSKNRVRQNLLGGAILHQLKAYGVDCVFGIPGVHTLEFYRQMETAGVAHIGVRHEQGAGFMADGYARVSGRPGTCLLIPGPGVTNAATPIGEAYSDSVPVLVISAVNARADLGMGRGALHEITDQEAVTRPLTAFSATVQDPSQANPLLARAFSHFASRRPRPVHIQVPLDVMDLDATLEKLAAKKPRHARLIELRFFGGLSVEEAAQELGISKETAKSDWRFARVWINRELSRGGRS